MTESSEEDSSPLIGVINEGTNTASFVVCSVKTWEEIVYHTERIKQICPHEGWQEQDPMEIIDLVRKCISETLLKMEEQGIDISRIVTLGITNQRETSILWDSTTGQPLYNAIVWSDIRAVSLIDNVLAKVPDNDKNALKPICGLPISTLFSALKIRWMIENVPEIRKAIREQKCMFGTVDTWIVWNLTGGVKGGLHITDVTNASRTMLMNIESLQWDSVLCRYMQVPKEILPTIHSSSEIYGYVAEGQLKNIPISGILGNQQSALIGEMCLNEGEAKSTYRAGCFVVYNTGTTRIDSSHGLVTTVAYQLGKSASPNYALEGSVAVAGSSIMWLKENMNLIDSVPESENVADEVKTTGDVYFVPAFTGLYAPYWRNDARGILCGLTEFTTKQHIVRACLEAVCYQVRDILEAVRKDTGLTLITLKANGTMAQNDLLLQLQADICGIPVDRSAVPDVSTLGIALTAAQAEGIDLWNGSPIALNFHNNHCFEPCISNEERNHKYNKWKMAVQRSFGWATTKKSLAMTDERYRLLASLPGTLFLITNFIFLILSKEFAKEQS
ncbi:glycerol kinase-like [Schistocerca cancellata]|uniref:glycerol kinase-like n=1 Tax=Schistocerca cancellata TaxID=274614 RepID=UPI002117E2CF|nr:glycerol kinase-like [Schistocerca cancellata]